MKLSKSERKKIKKSKWYLRGKHFQKTYRKRGNTLDFLKNEISIASKNGKLSITVNNPLTKYEKELLGGYFKLILDMKGKIKEPWTFREVDYLKEKQLATITYELYERD